MSNWSSVFSIKFVIKSSNLILIFLNLILIIFLNLILKKNSDSLN